MGSGAGTVFRWGTLFVYEKAYKTDDGMAVSNAQWQETLSCSHGVR